MASEQVAGRPAAAVALQERSRLSSALQATKKFARRKPLGAFGAVVLLVLIFLAIFAPLIAPYNQYAFDSERLVGPSISNWAGTDQFGRDVLSRVIWGARISLYVGVAVTIAALIPAVALGIVSAYFGGWVDYLLQRFVDTIQSVPYLIMLIAIMVVLGPSLINVIIALSFRRAVVESRIMRGATMGILNQTYVDSARASGATDIRIMVQHLLPNIMPTIIVIASLGFGGVILAEASLSFLGYGVPPPTPSWGGMLAADGRAYMFAAPWMLIAPTAALALVVFGVNMFGDAMRDVLDPRLRGSQ